MIKVTKFFLLFFLTHQLAKSLSSLCFFQDMEISIRELRTILNRVISRREFSVYSKLLEGFHMINNLPLLYWIPL